MEIQSGTRLGPYEILAPVGAGGMGQVWRAKDTRLDREVAIKVLPPDFAANTQLQARFEREAKTISSLNHPHICTLHDVGHESGTHFLVMEMIEGESLADRLAKGRLPMDQVLRIGTQIAAALDVAHRKGIIHRDLKPGNVMLTKTGAKLLDFGLAKSGAPTSGVIAGLTEMPTQARPLTQEGTILGTFQYMAPEQLEGQEADARTDIFALGALLYEMATGQRAFDGKTRTSLIAAIVSGTPRPVSELVPMTPPAFEHVVRRCLEKEADDRWQSAHDIADQLRWISEAGSQAGVPVPVARRRITRDRVLAIALAASLVAIGLLVQRLYRSRLGAAQSYELSIPAITAEYSRAGLCEVSPDGTMVVFPANGTDGKRRLWIRRLDSFTAKPLEGTEAPGTPCWSPDSKAVAFSSRGKIFRVSVEGGPVQVIADHQGIAALSGLAWGSSGLILAGSTEVGIHKVPASGGSFELLTKPDRARHERGHALPRFLADGRRFTFVAPFRDESTHELMKRLYIGSLDGPAREIGPTSSEVLVDEESGYLLFVSDSTLMAVKFDVANGKMHGDPVPILDDVDYFDPIGLARVSLAKTGVLTAQSRAGGSTLHWLDLAGRHLGGIGDVPVSSNFRISRDGSRIFAGVLDPKIGTYDLFAFDAARGGGSRLTYGRGWEAHPVPMIDGMSVFYAADRVGPPDIMKKVLDSPEEDRGVLAEVGVQFPNDVSPDGKLLLYQTDQDPAMRLDLWVLPLSGGSAKPYPIVRSPYIEFGGRFSPDGAQLAYTSNESGRNQIYVRPFPGPGPARQVSQTVGNWPRWSHDGRSLYYLGDGKLLRATAPFDKDPELLFENHDIVSYELAPDETRILAVMTSGFDASPPTLVITNWRTLLEKRGK